MAITKEQYEAAINVIATHVIESSIEQFGEKSVIKYPDDLLEGFELEFTVTEEIRKIIKEQYL